MAKGVQVLPALPVNRVAGGPRREGALFSADVPAATPEAMAAILREKAFAYWHAGGNGEATLDTGAGGPLLSIKHPVAGRFFILRVDDWTVPFNGGPCDAFIEDEHGGNRFLIPTSCLIGPEDAVNVLTYFLSHRELWPGVPWRSWSELPLPADYPHEG
jgi:hypothetical protein